MYARVVVDKRTKSLDKFFDYRVPDGLEVNIGSSVIVPFGTKNIPTEAYVFELSETTSAKRIKEIQKLSGKGVMFDKSMTDVIKYMREKYLCSYIEAVHACIPAGTGIKSVEYICLLKEDCSVSGGRKRQVVDFLRETGAPVEFTELCERFGDVSGIVRELVNDGVVERSFDEIRNIKDKYTTVVSIAVSAEEAEAAAQLMQKKAPNQARLLELLSQVDFISIRDLKILAGDCSSSLKALEQKGFVLKSLRETFRDPYNKYVKPDNEKQLTDEQKSVLYDINTALDENEFKKFLLYGVTGSGKTEVFMQAVSQCIKSGRQAVVLVPEISLTPQTVNRFTSRFGDRVAVFHSGLSLGEKFDQWKKMRDGACDVVIGARSAVFAPFKNIGITVIDEEHSDTYKSEISPRYDAREVAEFRMRANGGVLLLASATPRIEDYYDAGHGKLNLLKMEKRYNNNSMPEIYITDMRSELKNGNKSMFSKVLYDEINKNLENREQTILFLNRRGFSTFVCCRECGFVARCPNCNISLTYHKADDTLQCHYCGHTVKNYTVCPKCGSKYIRYFGGGTQRVEEEVKKLFPTASVIRMDIDTTGKKQSHQEILKRFESEKIDILIGTQMVSKGLDFENVTLVGVISADTMLNIDDFRSEERTFGILEQVSGRAGRGNKNGRAVIQTYTPENNAVIMCSSHDYVSFYNDEIKMREMMWYPPFSELICIQFSGESFQTVSNCARYFVKAMSYAAVPDSQSRVLGPVPCAVSKIKNKYRWQILIKCRNADAYNTVLTEARAACARSDTYKRVVISIDKKPLHIY